MDSLSTIALSGMLYDGFKTGAKLTTNFLKQKLQGWLFDEKVIEQLADKLKTLELDDLGEHIIKKKINETPDILDYMREIKLDQSIASVSQNHTGSGDNVVGSKITYNK